MNNLLQEQNRILEKRQLNDRRLRPFYEFETIFLTIHSTKQRTL